MTISLDKNDFVTLEKSRQIIVGLGWEESHDGDTDFDLDVSAFLLSSDNKVRRAMDMIFYGNLNWKWDEEKKNKLLDIMNVGVVHRGDDQSGRGEVDDIIELNGKKDNEQIFIETDKIPSDIQKIVFTVTIYDYVARVQNFGQMSNAYIRIIDRSKKEVLASFDLKEDYSTKTAIIAGALVRESGEWSFQAIGEGREGGLLELCYEYGVNVK